MGVTLFTYIDSLHWYAFIVLPLSLVLATYMKYHQKKFIIKDYVSVNLCIAITTIFHLFSAYPVLLFGAIISNVFIGGTTIPLSHQLLFGIVNLYFSILFCAGLLQLTYLVRKISPVINYLLGVVAMVIWYTMNFSIVGAIPIVFFFFHELTDRLRILPRLARYTILVSLYLIFCFFVPKAVAISERAGDCEASSRKMTCITKKTTICTCAGFASKDVRPQSNTWCRNTLESLLGCQEYCYGVPYNCHTTTHNEERNDIPLDYF